MDIRAAFEARDRISLAAWQIAEREIETGPLTYLSVDYITLDDDADYPTVVIQCSERWQGNQEDHTLVIPLEDFEKAMQEGAA